MSVQETELFSGDSLEIILDLALIFCINQKQAEGVDNIIFIATVQL